MSPNIANPSQCPSCGKPASGRFCGSCGATLSGRSCASCGSGMAAGAKFCGACGVSTTGAQAPAAPRPPTTMATGTIVPYAVAGAVVIVALVAVLLSRQGTAPPPPADGVALGGTSPAAAPLPDLTVLLPRERFDTLYNRVMRSSEAGDAASAARFAPMALDAYARLDSVDADARYHAAMIRLHTGDPTGAAALADTITITDQDHLFGYVVRGTVARLQRDDAALAREQAEFLRRYEAEVARARPEYNDHQFILNQFVTEARARAGGGGG